MGKISGKPYGASSIRPSPVPTVQPQSRFVMLLYLSFLYHISSIMIAQMVNWNNYGMMLRLFKFKTFDDIYQFWECSYFQERDNKLFSFSIEIIKLIDPQRLVLYSFAVPQIHSRIFL